jgi:hypothetical protein
MRKQIYAEMNRPAPGADTDLLAEDFSLPSGSKGAAKLEVVAQLVTESKLHLMARRKSGPTKATGSITVVDGSLLADGDDFTLDDGVNPAVNFEFDSNGVVAGDVTIMFDGNETEGQIAHKVRDAINAAADLYITASLDPDDEAVVLLENDLGGTDGNQTIGEAVGDAGFTVENMEGGLDDGEVLMPLNADVALLEGTPTTMEVPINADHEYNLQLDEDGDIELLQVTVVRGE